MTDNFQLGLCRQCGHAIEMVAIRAEQTRLGRDEEFLIREWRHADSERYFSHKAEAQRFANTAEGQRIHAAALAELRELRPWLED